MHVRTPVRESPAREGVYGSEVRLFKIHAEGGSSMRALNIGCGRNYLPSTSERTWVNIDASLLVKADMHCDATVLSGYYHGVGEIVANDILEHIPYNVKANPLQWKQALESWTDCLLPGGRIRIQVPCLDSICKLYLTGELDETLTNRVIYGDNTNWSERHYQLFTEKRLVDAMKECGLEIMSVEYLHICLIVVGRKK